MPDFEIAGIFRYYLNIYTTLLTILLQHNLYQIVYNVLAIDGRCRLNNKPILLNEDSKRHLECPEFIIKMSNYSLHLSHTD